MLRPGDHIDLIYTGKGANQTEDQTLPLLSGVTVLATGQTVTKTDDATGKDRTFSTVTLEVSPLDADRVIVAKAGGRVTAVLRHPDDLATNSTRPLVAANLLGGIGGNGNTVQYIIGGGGGLAQLLQGQVANTRGAGGNGSGVAPTAGKAATAMSDAAPSSQDADMAATPAGQAPAADRLRVAAAPDTSGLARASH
jgi:pilus assembly protein CpaB